MNDLPDFATLLNIHLQRADERSGAWLARRLSVHPSTVTKWLNGDSRPKNLELIERITDILGIYDQVEQQQLFRAAGYLYNAPKPSTAAATNSFQNIPKTSRLSVQPEQPGLARSHEKSVIWLAVDRLIELFKEWSQKIW